MRSYAARDLVGGRGGRAPRGRGDGARQRHPPRDPDARGDPPARPPDHRGNAHPARRPRPWTVRNAGEFDRFLPFGTQSGYTLAGAYNSAAEKPDRFQAAWRNPETTPDYAPLFHRPGTDEGDLDAALRHDARHFASDHPGHVLSVLRLNTLRLLDLGPGHAFVSGVSYTEMAIPKAWRWSLRVGLYLTLALALAGAVLLVRDRRGPLWLWLFPALLFASVVFVLGAPRYRAPVDPFLVLLAAYAVRSRTSVAAPHR